MCPPRLSTLRKQHTSADPCSPLSPVSRPDMFQLLRLATQQLAFGDESKCPFSRSRPTRPRSVPKHGLGQRVQDAGAIAGPTRRRCGAPWTWQIQCCLLCCGCEAALVQEPWQQKSSGRGLAPRDSADCRLLARRHPSVWRTQLTCRAGWLLLTSVLLLRSPPLLIARPLPLHIDPCAHSSPRGHASRDKSLGFAGRGLLREQRG